MTDLVERLIGRIGQDFDGECHLTEAEARDIASEITRLRDYAEGLDRALVISDAEVHRLRGLLEAWEKLAGRDRINLVGKNGDRLDEIVLTGMAHLEQTTTGSWYLGLHRPDGSGYQVWLSAKKGPMAVHFEGFEARNPGSSPK